MRHRNTIIRNLLLTAAFTAVLAACERHKIIPDKTLAAIFHDAFVTNAYIENQRFQTDSLDIYSPIFESYGYTVEDVQYTIGNFSKRKSARLGDIVEETIKQLEEEGLYYEREVAVLDTIDNIARRTFRRTVYTDSLIRVPRLRDTGLLRITIDDIRPGDYRIDFDYRIDSLDDAVSRRAVFLFERADSSSTGRQQQSLYKNNRTEHVSRTLTADTSARRLKINLLEFSQPRAPRKMNHFGVTVTNLKVVHTPDTGSALDSLFEKQLPVRIFYRGFFDGEEVETMAEAEAETEDTDTAEKGEE